MAKLIDLTGATVTVPAGWTATSDYGKFHAIGTTKYGEADFFYIGYDLGYFLPEIETDSIVCSLLPIKFQNGESFWITFSSGDDTSNPDLIQWFLDNNATIEGGVYEQDEQLDTFLTEMGDAIREVKGTTGLINARDMIGIVRGMNGGEDLTTELSEYDELNSELEDVINSLPDAGSGSEPTLQEKTATPTTSQQTVIADSGYDGLSKVTVAAIPSSYVKPTTTKGATTYTPTTSNQTIASGTYLSGTQTIKGDANLKAENIKAGVSIFGVTGTHSGAEDLDAELTAQETKIAELSALLDAKASGGGSIETVDVTISNTSGSYIVLYYNTISDELITGNEQTLSGSSSITIKVLKNAIVTAYLQNSATDHSLANVELFKSVSFGNTDQVRTYKPVNNGSIAFTASSGGW